MEKDDDDANINRQQRLVAVVAARPSALDELPPELWQIVIAMLDAEAARGDGVARFARDLFYDSSSAAQALLPSARRPPKSATIINGLAAAARNGHLELVRYTMDKYATILDDARNPYSTTNFQPVMRAAVESEHFAVLAYLLKQRPVYEKLVWSIALRLGRTNVLNWLRDTRSLHALRQHMGSERGIYLTALQGLDRGAFASVQWLFANGMDARAVNLWPAVLATQNAEIREYVYAHKIGKELGRGHVLTTLGLDPTRTREPFDEEAEARALETVEWLRDRHAVFDGPLAYTLVPAYGYVSVARLLVQLGMTADAVALYTALTTGRLSMVRWLAEEQHLALTDSTEYVSRAIMSNSQPTLAYILAHGAPINPDRAPWIATGFNNLWALQQLVDAGVPLDAGLCVHAIRGHGCKASTLRWLIEHGAPHDVNELRALVTQNPANRKDADDPAWAEMRAYVATL